MRRRELLMMACVGAVPWPLAARSQSMVMQLIGYLGPGTLEGARPNLTSFREGLREAGYVEGINSTLEGRWANGDYMKLPALARELVERQPAVIVTGGATPTALAAKAATLTIPIVFVLGSDPVEFGLVKSFARPGGNVTGVTVLDVELVAKAFEVLHELVPAASTIGVLVNPSNVLASSQKRVAETAARNLGVRATVLGASNISDVDAAFATIKESGIGALLVTGEPFFVGPARAQLIDLAAQHKVPTAYLYRLFTTIGGLMSYGTNLSDAHRMSGVYAGRILRGEKPTDLPVQRSTRIELSINMKAAKDIGLTVPQSILARADEVIE